MLIFEERGKPENPEKNLSEQSREPTTDFGLYPNEYGAFISNDIKNPGVATSRLIT